MKKLVILVLAVVLLQPTTFALGKKNTMDKVKNSWMGEILNTIVDKFGYPDKHIEFDNRTIYTGGVCIFNFY